MIKVDTFIVGELETNCYLLEDTDTKELLVIDPGDKSEELVKEIEKRGANLRYILLTHGHFDHISNVANLVSLFSPKVCACKDELTLISRGLYNLSVLRNFSVEPFDVDIELCDNDEIPFGDKKIKFIKTPGHTAGGGCYITEDMIFSGDTLFCESIGRSDFPTSNSLEIIRSVRMLKDLEGDYTVYPGHGVATTLEHERKYNPYMR